MSALSKECWLIWSNEHNQFWRADRLGYTSDPDQAGRYAIKEATAICWNANQCREGRLPNEIITPSSEVIEYLDRLAPQATAGEVNQPTCAHGTPFFKTCPECKKVEPLHPSNEPQPPAPLPPDIAEIEKRHRFDDEFRPFSALMNDQILEAMEAAHSDRAALLAHIRSRQGVVDFADLRSSALWR